MRNKRESNLKIWRFLDKKEYFGALFLAIVIGFGTVLEITVLNDRLGKIIDLVSQKKSIRYMLLEFIFLAVII